MIVESLIDVFFNIFTFLFSGMEFIKIPIEFIGTLSTILCYGIWIVGLDIFSLFVSMIIGWWLIKFTVGLAVFIWELLPLT